MRSRGSTGLPESGRPRQAGRGQQATFADAPRVFVRNVRNRESNPAADGQKPKYGLLKMQHCFAK